MLGHPVYYLQFSLLILFITLYRHSLVVSSTSTECTEEEMNAWKAKCPVLTEKNLLYLTGENVGNDADVTDVNNVSIEQIEQAREAAQLLTGKSIETVNKLRKYSDAWYTSSLDNIMTFVCEETAHWEDMHRCIQNHSDPRAVKNIDDECIIMTGPGNCHAMGMCERISNCKWTEAVENGDNRPMRYNDEDAAFARVWVMEEYPKTFLPFIVPGIILSVIVVLSWLIFCFLRCCCNRCWGRSPRVEGYTRCQVLLPTIFFIVFTVGIIVCAGISYVQNDQITHGVQGVVESINVSISNINILATNVLNPLEDIKNNVNAAVVAIDNELSDTEWIKDDFEQLQQMMLNFSQVYTNIGPFPFSDCDVTKAWCVTCPENVCGAVAEEIEDASDSMQVAKELLLSTVNGMKDNIGENKDLLLSNLDVADEMLSMVNNLTLDTQSSVNDIKNQFDELSTFRMAGVLSIFALAAACSVLGIFGVICGLCHRKNIFIDTLHLSWIFGVVVCILGFIVASAMITLALVWNDGCHYLTIAKQDVSPYVPQYVSKVINTCFNDESLLEALEMEENLSFTCSLEEQFSQTDDLNVNDKFDDIYTYGDSIDLYTKDTFGYSSTDFDDLIGIANIAITATVPTTPIDTDNIARPWEFYGQVSDDSTCTVDESDTDNIPTCYMEAKCGGDDNGCYEAYSSTYYYYLSFEKLEEMLKSMKMDYNGNGGDNSIVHSSDWNFTTSIREYSETYAGNLEDLKDNTVTILKDGLVGSVLENVDVMKCSMTCGWINISYDILYENFCGTLLGATLTISVCIFMMSVFLIPVIICAIILQKRLRGVRKGSMEALKFKGANV